MSLNLAIKLATYMLLISTFDNTSTIPILDPVQVQQNEVIDTIENVSLKPTQNVVMKIKVRRQDPVVQPIWTADQGFGELFQDYNVRVTDKKLEETEAIRDIIQDTVNNGTYAVELDENDFKTDSTDPEIERKPSVESEERNTANIPEPEPKPLPQPVLQPVSEPKPEPKSEAPSQPIPKTPVNKSKKVETVGTSSAILIWLKKIFALPFFKK